MLKVGNKVVWAGPNPGDRGVGTVTYATWMNGSYVLWSNGEEEPCYHANLKKLAPGRNA